MAERAPEKRKVTGSTPVPATHGTVRGVHAGPAGLRRAIGSLLLAALLVVAATACSTGGGDALGSGTQAPDNGVLCGYIAQLADSATALQQVDVRDPTTFTKSLDDAVHEYVQTLDQIAPRVDANLKSTVRQVRSLVLAHRFADATAARVPLDTWTADHC